MTTPDIPTERNKPVAQAHKNSPAAGGTTKAGLGRRLFEFFSSLRLTVVFLALSVVLVFIGTVAQVEEGLYAAQERYFRSLIIWWHPGAGMPGDGSFRIPVFPGGYFIGGVLLVNLIVAYIKRFKFTRKKIGLIIIHVGLVLLLVGQLATDMLSVESAMQLFEGDTKNYSEDFRANELVLIDKTDPDKDRVYSIPHSRLKENAEIRDPNLPLTIKVQKHWANVGLIEPGTNNPPMARPSGATAGSLKDILVIPAPPVTEMDSRDMPGAVVEILDGGKSQGSFLVSSLLVRGEQFRVGNRTYEVAMRFARYYYPFSITLLKATHEKYKGTEIPKNFASRVRVENSSAKQARETEIYMNNPLRYEGLTFFQFQMGADEARMRQGERASSTFQVVRNPSWLTPYLSCVLISIGLIVQFTQHLVGFIRRK